MDGSSVVTLILLILLSGLFSGLEIALFSLSLVKVQTLAAQKIPGSEALLKIKRKPQKLLATLLIGNNVVNIYAASLATVLATNQFGSKGVGIAAGIMTLLILIFGEITPKAVFHAHAERCALFFAPLLRGLMWLMSPVTYLFEHLSTTILKVFGHLSPTAGVSEAEINVLTQLGFEAGVIEKMEKNIIQHAFEFNDIPARNVMTPKSEIFSLEASLTLRDAYPHIANCPFSRIAIYNTHHDNIVGILYVRDVLQYFYRNDLDVSLREIMREPLVVPEQKILDELFQEFQSLRIHIAIVVNEHGETVGLVTLEDLLEELVGEIDDERTVQKISAFTMPDGSILIQGNAEIAHLNEKYHTQLPAKKFRTLHALLLHSFQRIPKSGDQTVVKGTRFTVQEATRKRIIKVRMEPLHPKP